ncbi:hypothetical protein ACFSHQ_16360 [Gemmobacter lanyuensis]
MKDRPKAATEPMQKAGAYTGLFDFSCPLGSEIDAAIEGVTSVTVSPKT